MKNFAKTKYLLALSSIFLFVVIFGLVYEIVFIKQAGEKNLLLQADLSAEEQSIASFKNLSKTASTVKDDSQKANNFFIKNDEIVNFLDLVESFSSTTDTQIKVQTVNEVAVNKDQKLLDISIGVSGAYKDVYHAMRILEEIPYQTELKKVSFSFDSSSEKTKTRIWTAQIELIGVIY